MANIKRNEQDRDRALLLFLFSTCLRCRIEYDDNAQFNNLETLIVQNNVDIVYTYGSVETGKLQHIAKLLEQLDVRLQIVKKKWVSVFVLIVVTLSHSMWSTSCLY